MLTEKIKISDYLDPLRRFGRNGRVHSVFDRSFNVMIGQQLVNINNYHNYLTGFGIFLPDALFEQVLPLIEVGNRVQVREHGLTFYSTKGTFSLSLEEKRIGFAAGEGAILHLCGIAAFERNPASTKTRNQDWVARR